MLGRRYLEDPLYNIFEILDERFYEDGKVQLKSVFGEKFSNKGDQIVFVGRHDSLLLDAEDEMMPPRVIQFLTEYSKINVV